VASPGKPLLPDFEIELPELPNERPPVSEQSIRTINEIIAAAQQCFGRFNYQ